MCAYAKKKQAKKEEGGGVVYPKESTPLPFPAAMNTPFLYSNPFLPFFFFQVLAESLRMAEAFHEAQLSQAERSDEAEARRASLTHPLPWLPDGIQRHTLDFVADMVSLFALGGWSFADDMVSELR